MEHIVDAKITKVYEGPNGEGEWGRWQIYNLYLDKGEKKKFGWMQSGKKVIPKEGMELKHIGYEIEEDGQYTNYKIKEMELKEGTESTPQAIPNAKEDMGSIPKAKNDREVSFYVAYAKDIAVAILNNGGDFETADLDAMVRKIAKAGVIMMNESTNSVPIPSQDSVKAPPVQDNKKPVPSPPSDTPAVMGAYNVDQELKATLKGFAKENSEEYFKVLGLHGASNAEEVLGFEKEAQQTLLRDLEKAFKMPF